MNVIEQLEEILEHQRERKEVWVEDNPETPDMPTLVMAYRDDELVMQAACHADRDKMLELANVVAFGSVAQALVCSFETYGTELKENPITGDPWEQGEMQYLAHHYDGFKKGWVHEAMSISAYDREGNFVMVSYGFEVDGNKVIWQEPKTFRSNEEEEKSYVAGILHDTMKVIMGADTVETVARADLGDEIVNHLTSDMGIDKYIHADIATVKHVLAEGFAIGAGLVAVPGSEREARIEVLLKASLERDDRPFKLLIEEEENK